MRNRKTFGNIPYHFFGKKNQQHICLKHRLNNRLENKSLGVAQRFFTPAVFNLNTYVYIALFYLVLEYICYIHTSNAKLWLDKIASPI